MGLDQDQVNEALAYAHASPPAQPLELDPRWNWNEYEVRTVAGVVKRWTVRGTCNHLEVVPVEAGGVLVAHLCLTCDQQLPV